jgi:ribosomal protein L35
MAGRGHLLSHKGSKRKRRLRRGALVEGKIAKNYRLLLQPGA